MSVLQLLRGNFPDVVQRILADTGVPASALELELTESVLMANAAQTAGKLQAFREIGVSLAIDDFGTGYSSRSEEHTSELQSLMRISYAVFCLKQNTKKK